MAKVMGEAFVVTVDPAEFDRRIAESRATGTSEAGDLRMIIKPAATVTGRCAVMLTFSAMVDGREVRVQTVTTGALIRQIAAFVGGIDDPLLGDAARYPQGKLGPDDEGELEIRVGSDEARDVVVIDFGKPVHSIAFQPEQALHFAGVIDTHGRTMIQRQLGEAKH